MNLETVFWKYIAGPVVADAKDVETAVVSGYSAQPGYNTFNTALWGLISLCSLIAAYKWAESRDSDLEPSMVLYSTPLILMGGLLRFLEDAGDLSLIASAALVTPLIYFLMAVLFGVSGLLSIKTSRFTELEPKKIFGIYGTALLIFSAAVTAAKTQNLGWNLLLLVPPVLAATVLSAGFYIYLKNTDLGKKHIVLICFSQIFGGSASTTALYHGGYTQKQIIPQIFTGIFGPPGILVLKTGIIAAGIYSLRDLENKTLKTALVFVLTVVGLATGFRVALRTAAGV